MELAPRFGAEIISADSRQVYRYLDICTDKPSLRDRERVPHHLLDLVLPDERYTVVEFRRDAERALRGVAERRRVAFLVGGTGHYARSLLERLSFPEFEPDIERTRLISAYVRGAGTDVAIREIAHTDQVTAQRLDPANHRRVARALEIVRVTSAPVPATTRCPIPALVLGIEIQRERLYQRIDDRIDRQMAEGLVDETKSLLDMGYPQSLPVLSGLGYGHMISYITGAQPLEDAVQRYKHATHAFARRQLTWFRKEPRLQWLNADEEDFVKAAALAIKSYLNV
jgi:tRNA dimethylallyltransferase